MPRTIGADEGQMFHPDDVNQVYNSGTFVGYRVRGVRPEPVVKAEALREAYDHYAGTFCTVHELAQWIKDRADELDPPVPSRPDEPKGLGAVVEAGSNRFVYGVRKLFVHAGRGRWVYEQARYADDDVDASWDQLTEPSVISEGVSLEGGETP